MVERGRVEARVGSGRLVLEEGAAEVFAPVVKLEAKEVQLNGKVVVSGDLSVSGTVSAQRVEGQRVLVGRDDALTVPRAQAAFDEVAASVSSVILSFSSHTHQVAGPFTLTPTSAPARAPYVRL